MNAIVWAAATGFRQQLGGMMQWLYQLVLGLGGPGLFLLALADSSFLSVPEGNDILIVVLSTGQTWSTMAYYAAMTTGGSVAGCYLLYSVGRRGGSFMKRRISLERIERVGRLYRRWGVLALVIPSILPPPTPFKIFVLSAGLFQVPPVKFLLAVAAGRSFRYFSWGVLAVLYGNAARAFLERHLHVVGVALFLLMAGAAIAYILVRLARKRAPQGETA